MISRARAVTLLLGSMAVVLVGCSPGPTPVPPSTVTVEQAAQAYSAFSTDWTGTYTDALNAASAAADADPTKVAQYARTIAGAYTAFADGIRAIQFPGTVQPLVEQELETVGVLVALARQLESGPSNISVKTELHGALARVAESSANVEAAFGLSH